LRQWENTTWENTGAGEPAGSPVWQTIKIGAGWLPEARGLILAARETVAQGVNAALARLCWRIGQDILKDERADYGEEVFPTPSGKLIAEPREPKGAEFPPQIS